MYAQLPSFDAETVAIQGESELAPDSADRAAPKDEMQYEPSGDQNIEGTTPLAPARRPPATPPSPYKGVFYDNDFSYLTASDVADGYLGDGLKRNAIGDCWMLDVGGEYRLRHHHEVNLRGTDLSGRSDDFYCIARDCLRTRNMAIGFVSTAKQSTR
jgi:hypothetical protein